MINDSTSFRMNCNNKEQISRISTTKIDNCVENSAKNSIDTGNEMKSDFQINNQLENPDKIISNFCDEIKSKTDGIIKSTFDDEDDENVESFVESVNCNFEDILSGKFEKYKDECWDFLRNFISNNLNLNNIQNILNINKEEISKLIKSLLVIYTYYSLYFSKLTSQSIVFDDSNSNYVNYLGTYIDIDQIYMENVKIRICNFLNVDDLN